jgi:hypothetical protein
VAWDCGAADEIAALDLGRLAEAGLLLVRSDADLGARPSGPATAAGEAPENLSARTAARGEDGSHA